LGGEGEPEESERGRKKVKGGRREVKVTVGRIEEGEGIGLGGGREGGWIGIN